MPRVRGINFDIWEVYKKKPHSQSRECGSK